MIVATEAVGTAARAPAAMVAAAELAAAARADDVVTWSTVMRSTSEASILYGTGENSAAKEVEAEAVAAGANAQWCMKRWREQKQQQQKQQQKQQVRYAPEVPSLKEIVGEQATPQPPRRTAGVFFNQNLQRHSSLRRHVCIIKVQQDGHIAEGASQQLRRRCGLVRPRPQRNGGSQLRNLAM